LATATGQADTPVGAGRLEFRAVRRDPAVLRCSSGLETLPEPGPCPVCAAEHRVRRFTTWQAPIDHDPGKVTIEKVPAYWCDVCERRAFAPDTMVALYHHASKAAARLQDAASARRLLAESKRIAYGIEAERAYKDAGA
jgi:hypothetical protein